jgi:signal peptidase II
MSALSRIPPRWRLFAAVVLIGVGADQVTKFLAVDRLTTAFQRVGATTLGEKVSAFWRLHHLESLATEPYYVVRAWWRMAYVENPNAAFSLGSFLPPGPRHAIFLVFAVVALSAILWFLRRLPPGARLQQFTLSLVFAGALGNVIDRVARRYVIDFVEWYWWNRPDKRWPTFNVADSMLTVGIVLLLLMPQAGARKGEEPARPARE